MLFRSSQLLQLAEELRAGGLDLVTEFGGRSVKAALKRADKSGIRWVLLAGEDELAAGELSLRDLDAGEQERLGRDAAIAKIKEQA